MSKRNLFFILTFSFACSCKTEKTDLDLKMEVVEKFIVQLKSNNPDSVFSMVFNKMSFEDEEHKLFNLKADARILNKYGVVAKENWKVENNPNNNHDRVKFIIPIADDKNPPTYHLIVSFPPPEISEKIGWYRIEGENFSDGPILAPEVFTPGKSTIQKPDSL